jgi:hypothetical protein
VKGRHPLGSVAGQKEPIHGRTGPVPRDPLEKPNARYVEVVPEQGPGTQVTSGAVATCRFENVCMPEQPLKLCPTESVVRISSEDTVNVMTMPWAVEPFHWPTLSDDGDGNVGSRPHAEASSPASVPTHKSAFVRVAIVTKPAIPCCRFGRAACCTPVSTG